MSFSSLVWKTMSSRLTFCNAQAKPFNSQRRGKNPLCGRNELPNDLVRWKKNDPSLWVNLWVGSGRVGIPISQKWGIKVLQGWWWWFPNWKNTKTSSKWSFLFSEGKITWVSKVWGPCSWPRKEIRVEHFGKHLCPIVDWPYPFPP